MQKKSRLVLKKNSWYFLLKFLVSALIDIINIYARGISEKSFDQKSVTKSRSKFSCEIVLQFQK